MHTSKDRCTWDPTQEKPVVIDGMSLSAAAWLSMLPQHLNRAERRAIEFGRAFSPIRNYHLMVVEEEKRRALTFCGWNFAGQVASEEDTDYEFAGLAYIVDDAERRNACEARDLMWAYTH